MILIRRLAILAALGLFALGAFAVLGWEVVQHRIARNEQAPDLVRIHQPANDFTFRTLDGNVEHLSDTRGKVVFVDLWGTWCIQCVAEMPTVQRLYNHYRNNPNVDFLIIDRLDSPATVRGFARLHGYDLPFYTMENRDIPASMQLNQYPATFLFARDGSLAARHTGAANWSAPRVIAFMDRLINEPDQH